MSFVFTTPEFMSYILYLLMIIRILALVIVHICSVNVAVYGRDFSNQL